MTVPGCGDNPYGDPEATCNQPELGSKLFGMSTTVEVVTWGDSVVVARVLGVEPTSPPTEYPTDGTRDGLVGRRVTLEVVQELWQNPGRQLPSVVETDVWGWTINQGVASEIRPPGEVTYRSGESYLVTLTEFRDGWGAIGEATFELDQDSAINPACPGRSRFAGDVDGLSPGAVEQLLAVTNPFPGMEPHLRLPIDQRLKAAVLVCKTERAWC